MPDEGRIDPAVIASLYAEHGESLRRFLVGMLRDPQLANDVLQAAFAKALESAHDTMPESRKAWLFRVAYHEAMAVKRRESVNRRALEWIASSGQSQEPTVDEPLLRAESVAAVRAALAELPPEQRRIVEMRIYEEKTFAVIAVELDIPLGTALARMRAAQQKLLVKLRGKFGA